MIVFGEISLTWEKVSYSVKHQQWSECRCFFSNRQQNDTWYMFKCWRLWMSLIIFTDVIKVVTLLERWEFCIRRNTVLYIWQNFQLLKLMSLNIKIQSRLVAREVVGKFAINISPLMYHLSPPLPPTPPSIKKKTKRRSSMRCTDLLLPPRLISVREKNTNLLNQVHELVD